MQDSALDRDITKLNERVYKFGGAIILPVDAALKTCESLIQEAHAMKTNYGYDYDQGEFNRMKNNIASLHNYERVVVNFLSGYVTAEYKPNR